MDSLPVELVQEIGSHCSDITSLASSSWRMRSSLLPQLMKSVRITSSSGLSSLAAASSSAHRHIRNLKIVFDFGFYNDFVYEESCRHELSTVLDNAPLLQSLSIQLTNTPYSNPWKTLTNDSDSFNSIERGLPIISSLSSTIYERLHTLSVEGVTISSVASIVRRSPNLSSLSVLLPNGLTSNEVSILKSSLRFSSSVRRLSAGVDGGDSNTDLEETLGTVANLFPGLESWNLQTRAFDVSKESLESSSIELESEKFKEILPALSSLHQLATLNLPITISSDDAMTMSKAAAWHIPSLKTVSWMSSNGPHAYSIQGSQDDLVVRPRSTPSSFQSAIRRHQASSSSSSSSFFSFDYSYSTTVVLAAAAAAPLLAVASTIFVLTM